MLRKFTGYRGVAALMVKNDHKFVIVARNPEDLQAVCDAILPEAGTINPDACQKSVLIPSNTLPEPKQDHE